MELDELKKSWNVLDQHLKDRKLVKDEDISRIITHAANNVHAMNNMVRKLRIASIVILFISAFTFIYNGLFSNTIVLVAFIAAIPAIGWDMFSSHYLSQTKIDEQPLAIVIARFNRLHQWMIRERLIGTSFILLLAISFFIYREVWKEGIAIMSSLIGIWVACLALPLWIYRKNLERLREIRKNLSELKELNDIN